MYSIQMLCLCAFKSLLSGLHCTVQCETVEYADNPLLVYWLDNQVILRNILIVQHMRIFSDGSLIIMGITFISLYILLV
jgi:hypothetical protein